MSSLATSTKRRVERLFQRRTCALDESRSCVGGRDAPGRARQERNAELYAATKFAVEGLSLSVAKEVDRFGIKVTVVEPGFFRTDLLAPGSAVFGDLPVEGYDPPAAVKAQWQTHHHTQSGDPEKLGKALVQLAAMESPPRQFAAGSDAFSGITADLQARIAEAEAHKGLSTSLDGDF